MRQPQSHPDSSPDAPNGSSKRTAGLRSKKYRELGTYSDRRLHSNPDEAAHDEKSANGQAYEAEQCDRGSAANGVTIAAWQPDRLCASRLGGSPGGEGPSRSVLDIG